MPELVSGYQNGSRIKIVYSYTQSVPNNTSTITMTLYVHRDSYGPTWAYDCDAYIQLDGTKVMTYDGYFNIGSSWVKIGSTVSRTVTHNADGTKTVSLKGFFDSLGMTSKLTNISVTGNVTLPTIPRASSFTLSTSNVTAGSTGMTVNISRASSSFTHTVQWKFGGHTHTVNNVATSTSYTIPVSWLDAIPNNTSGTGTVTVTTYSGGKAIGSSSKSFTVTAGSSVVPSFSSLSVTRVNGDVPSSWGVYVKTKSKATLQIVGAAGIYGSTIKSYSISGGGYSGTSSSLTTGFLNSAGTITFTAKITDSRGRSATKTVSITVQDYSPPEIASMTALRSNSSGTTQDDGEYISLTAVFAGSTVGGRNTISGKYRYMPDGGSWSSLATISSGVRRTFSASGESTFTVQVQVSDAFTTISRDVVVNSIQFTMDIKVEGKGIAFGKAAEYDDLLDVGWDAHFRGDAQIDGDIYQNNTKLIDIGSNSNGTYIKFSDGTMICTKQFAFTSTFTGQEGTMYYGTRQSLGNYAASFASLPALCATISDGASAFVDTIKTPGIAAIGTINLYRNERVTTAITMTINIIAIGRWKN